MQGEILLHGKVFILKSIAKVGKGDGNYEGRGTIKGDERRETRSERRELKWRRHSIKQLHNYTSKKYRTSNDERRIAKYLITNNQ
ncbi:MAG TPA: hypothetical protein DEQ87_12155 [Algoriphagus sp.]|nr:hypothetical protein [Algoriphagus sp.]MAN88001.1 hypothetical protein [Algoriphagus sp.]HAH38156.1 hypothetical protein [Algoriphagus sp.]HCD88372.1 hypothetical protein [Algoriphagus sp.]HCH45960.1 hypothetical protein [Algoriphagus sp.]